jgi:hypothetical protein
MAVAGRTGRAHEDEVFLPFPMPRERIPDASHFRSTWLTASIASLRDRGLGDAYAAALAPEHKEQILSVVPGVWLPMNVARAHYAAADSLGLSNAELVEIGESATRRANATALSLAFRLARGAGVTPWTILGQVQRLWDRTCLHGGGIAVWKLGPKEARLEVVGYPLADMRYNRITFRGIIGAVVELFCEKAYVREIPSLCDRRSLGFRLSWA